MAPVACRGLAVHCQAPTSTRARWSVTRKARRSSALSPSNGELCERCAAIAASIARRPAERAAILEAHDLAQERWGALEERWEDAIRWETERGRARLLRAYDSAYVAQLEAARFSDAPIVTELAPLAAFYPAEAYHQDYYARNPGQGYCQAVIAPKLAKFRRTHAASLRR